VERLHRPSTYASALVLGIRSHCFDVTDSAPWLVAELDPSRYGAGMADQTVGAKNEHVPTTVGVVGVFVAEAVAESPMPEIAQGHPSRAVDLFTFDYNDVHWANVGVQSAPGDPEPRDGL